MKKNSSELEYYKKLVSQINEINFKEFSNADLLKKSLEFMNQARHGGPLEDILVDAFALVKEAALRAIGLTAYDEQLIAGIAMHQGNLVEMQTGEGKTLAAVFPAYLNALTGIGVNIFTYNDYLARRDAGLMEPVYSMLGLTVGFVQEHMGRQQRKKAYSCDVNYITAKEAGFDYLRNFLCYEKEELIHRSFQYVIIDEADSILIDEARVPLVIAAKGVEADKSLDKIRDMISQLDSSIDFKIDEHGKNVEFTDTGIDFIEEQLMCGNLFEKENLMLLSECLDALQAEVLFHKDIDYIVREGKIELIDEFTGRTAEKRQWPDGIQAAVETKEGLKRQAEGRIMNQITLKGFIMLHKKIAGMTGTAKDAASEFIRFYNLEVVIIPTHKPCIREDFPNLVFTDKEAKYKALIKEVIMVHKTGQPILIGTASIRESAYLATELKKEGIHCQVLNAKNDEYEAKIIEQAGALSAITVSTNMAGRGTDIKLGGLNQTEHEKVAKLGGLYVIGTNIYESHRIDKQLRGRAGRQGDPGQSRFFISLEDDLIVKYGVENVLPKSFQLNKQDMPIGDSRILNGIEHLRRIVLGKNLDLRIWLIRYSLMIEQQKNIIQNRRMEILMDITPSGVLKDKEPELYKNLCLLIDESVLNYMEKKVALYHIDYCWSDYLEYILDVRDISYMAILRGKNPIDSFEAEAVNAFEHFQDKVAMNIISEFKMLKPTADGVNELLNKMSLPRATFTYLLKEQSYDGAFALKLNRVGFTSLALMFAAPFIVLKRFYDFLREGLNSKTQK